MEEIISKVKCFLGYHQEQVFTRHYTKYDYKRVLDKVDYGCCKCGKHLRTVNKCESILE